MALADDVAAAALLALEVARGMGLAALVTITRTGAGSIDPRTNRVSGGAGAQSFSAFAAANDGGDARGAAAPIGQAPTGERRLRRQLVLAPQTEARAPLPFDPAKDDLVTGFEGGSWRVMGCNPIRPGGGTAMLFLVDIER